MKKVLVIGPDNFFKQHLLFWLKAFNIEYDEAEENKFLKSQKYEKVIYLQDSLLEDHSEESMQNFFRMHIDELHTSLVGVDAPEFIYIDFTNGVLNPLNKINKDLKNLSVEMVKSYSKAVKKHYAIFYMYDLIGYKYDGVPDYYINNYLKPNHDVVFSNFYQNIHLVYIHDACKAICRYISSDRDRFASSEHHLRYDNRGIDLKKIVQTFANFYKERFRYIEFDNNQETAPYWGEPSRLLSNEYDMDKWIMIRRHQEYF